MKKLVLLFLCGSLMRMVPENQRLVEPTDAVAFYIATQPTTSSRQVITQQPSAELTESECYADECFSTRRGARDVLCGCEIFTGVAGLGVCCAGCCTATFISKATGCSMMIAGDITCLEALIATYVSNNMLREPGEPVWGCGSSGGWQPHDEY